MNNPHNIIKTNEIISSLLGERFIKARHSSGLEIYVFPKKLTTAYAVFGTKYGSINNTFGTSEDEELVTVPDGIAHFLEHKLFTNEDGSDSFERFSDFGADANAYTSFNKTAYVFSCTENFASSLGELIDFVTHPYFTEESVKGEIGIISEEIEMYDDSPSDRCFYGMLEAMYHSHSIKRNICGTVKSINEIAPDLLYRCYDIFYQLSNMALVVCGDILPNEVFAIADAHLPSTAKAFDIIKKDENLFEPREVLSSRLEHAMQISKPIFNIGFKDTEIPQSAIERLKKDAAMSILNEMIFSRAGTLYNELLESGMISPSLSYGYTVTETFAYNSIAGEANDPDAVLSKILEHIEEIRGGDLDISDFERGKRVMLAEFIKSFDSSDNIANNLFGFICEGADDCFLSYTEILESVDIAYVKKLFDTAFDKSLASISIINPLKNNEGESI